MRLFINKLAQGCVKYCNKLKSKPPENMFVNVFHNKCGVHFQSGLHIKYHPL